MKDLDKERKLYFDQASFYPAVKADDFLIAVGKKQSNSVYHVLESNPKPSLKHKRMTRYHLKVLKSDLITALKRDDSQLLFPMQWNNRKKKS